MHEEFNLNALFSFDSCPIFSLVCLLADLQVVVVAVQVNLISGVHMEYRVQTL